LDLICVYYKLIPHPEDSYRVWGVQDALFLNLILLKNSICFGQTYCPSSGILIPCSQQLVLVIQLLGLSASGVRMDLICCAHSIKTPDDGQKTCPKHAVLYQNKVEK